MPTVLRIGPWRLYFYSHEPHEPAHVHVDKGNASAKLGLHDLSIASNVGFSAHELRRIRRIVFAHRKLLWEKWNAYFQ